MIYYTVLWYAYKEPYRYFTHQLFFLLLFLQVKCALTKAAYLSDM